MTNLSKRGCLVLGIAIGLAIAGALYLSAYLWLTPNGYCLGTLLECFPIELTR